MKNVCSKLSTIADLEKNLGQMISTMNIEKREKQFDSQVKYFNRRIENIQDRLEETDRGIEEAKVLVKKIETAQSNYNTLIDNYEGIKTISTAFLNMKRTIKYSEKIANQKIKKIDENNLQRLDKFRYKLIFYSKDLNKQEYLMIKPVIDNIEKEFIDWECEILNFTKELLNPETDPEKIQTFLNMLNTMQRIDDESILAKRGRDGQVKESKKEYFTHSFSENQPFRFTISNSMISNKKSEDIQRDRSCKEISTGNSETNSFARMFYKENKYLASRQASNLKLRFIRNLLSVLVKREIGFILSDLKIFLEYEGYFNRKIENSIFQFIHEILSIRLQNKHESASDVLSVINFFNLYDEMTRAAHLSFHHPLVDVSELKSNYIAIMKVKLSSWVENITAAELKSIKARNVGLDEEEHFISTNFINLLKIVKEVLEPVTFDRSLYSSLLTCVISNVSHFKHMICDALQAEYSKNVASLVSGFEEYCICISNSGLKLTQYVSSISEYEGDEAENQSGLIELGEVFISLTRFSNSILSQFVIHTLKPALKKLFTNTYYKDELGVMNMFKATISDFLEDYKQSMNAYVFMTFVSDLVDQIGIAYFNQMVKKKSIIYQTLPEYIEKNEKSLNRTIMKYCNDENINFDFMTITPLLTVTGTEQFLAEVKRLKYEIKLQKDFVKAIIKKRTELSETEKRELTEAINVIYCDAEKSPKKGFFRGYM